VEERQRRDRRQQGLDRDEHGGRDDERDGVRGGAQRPQARAHAQGTRVDGPPPDDRGGLGKAGGRLGAGRFEARGHGVWLSRRRSGAAG
jgi:hypothetical protein